MGPDSFMVYKCVYINNKTGKDTHIGQAYYL